MRLASPVVLKHETQTATSAAATDPAFEVGNRCFVCNQASTADSCISWCNVVQCSNQLKFTSVLQTDSQSGVHTSWAVVTCFKNCGHVAVDLQCMQSCLSEIKLKTKPYNLTEMKSDPKCLSEQLLHVVHQKSTSGTKYAIWKAGIIQNMPQQDKTYCWVQLADQSTYKLLPQLTTKSWVSQNLICAGTEVLVSNSQWLSMQCHNQMSVAKLRLKTLVAF